MFHEFRVISNGYKTLGRSPSSAMIRPSLSTVFQSFVWEYNALNTALVHKIDVVLVTSEEVLGNGISSYLGKVKICDAAAKERLFV